MRAISEHDLLVYEDMRYSLISAILAAKVYEVLTIDQVVAMLIELQQEIEKIDMSNNVPFGFEPVNKFYEGVSASSKVIQQKINTLNQNKE